MKDINKYLLQNDPSLDRNNENTLKSHTNTEIFRRSALLTKYIN